MDWEIENYLLWGILKDFLVNCEIIFPKVKNISENSKEIK